MMTPPTNVDPDVLREFADQLDDHARQLSTEARGLRKRAKALRQSAITLKGLNHDSKLEPMDDEEVEQ